MSGVQSVIFDVGRVLYEWDLRHLFAKLIADEQELQWFLDNVVTVEWHFQHDAGRPLADMTAELKEQFPAQARLIDAYATRFNETIPGPVPGSLEIVADLHKRGIPLFAITNFGAEFWAQFRPRQPVFDLFADIVVSGVEKLVKPDPAIYAHACQRFGIEPASAIFIDDNHDNIESARNFGLHTHLFESAEGLRADLAARGLLA